MKRPHRRGLIGPQWRQGPSFDKLLAVSFDPGLSGNTVLRLAHERLDELAAAMPHTAEKSGRGREAVLTKLEQVLTAAAIPR